MHAFITLIVAVFATSASYVNGDMLLQSQINAFEAAIVDNNGKSEQVHGQMINVQMVYVYPTKRSVKYDKIDWRVLAQSPDGDDTSIYDFQLSDKSASSSSSESSGMDALLHDLPPLIKIRSDDSGSSEDSSNLGLASLLRVPSQLFRPKYGTPTTRAGATTTERSAEPRNNYFFQPDQSASQRGSWRVKRELMADPNNATFETPKVNNGPPQQTVTNTSSPNQVTTQVPNAAENALNAVAANMTTSNTATNVSITSSPMGDMKMKMNATMTMGNMTMGRKNAGSMVNTSSWMAILVPLFVIFCTRKIM